jgi:hypothetical protein
MNILGLDFTSAPKPRKPIRAAVGTLEGDLLSLRELRVISDFVAFEELLATFEGIGGYDFPFGLPITGIAHLQWGNSWTAIIAQVAQLELPTFIQMLKNAPHREFRASDRAAKAASPMNTVYPPVARMFYRGAPRLMNYQVSIYPCRPLEHSKHIALEVYPALAARRIVGFRPYKSDTKSKQSRERLTARAEIVDNLERLARDYYQISLMIDNEIRTQCLSDASGDTLDAVLAAIITAWAARTPNYRIPANADPREGWIVDPLTLAAANSL